MTTDDFFNPPRRRAGIVTLVFMLTVATGSTVAAVPIPSGNQTWYYKIGGASPVTEVLNPTATVQTLELNLGQATFASSFGCGGFNIEGSLKSAFQNLKNGLMAKLGAFVNGAIANIFNGLIMAAFQRAFPSLYEQFQANYAAFLGEYKLAVKSCEQVQQDALAGRNIFADWITIGKAAEWRRQAAANNNPTAIKTTVDKDGGVHGITFPKLSEGRIVDNAGGQGGPPIEVITDSVAAGWNVIQGRSPADNSGFAPPSPSPAGGWAPGHTGNRLAELFPTPASAAEYARDVLGDMELHTCGTCGNNKSTPGLGLEKQFSDHRKNIAARLTSLINDTGIPKADDLKKVSAPGVAVSARIIRTLRELRPDERTILAARLASESALAETIEEALAIRRLLRTGKKVPEIASYKPATDQIDAAIAEIEEEINNMLFEQRVNREIASNTASIILTRRNQLDSASEQVIPQKRPEKTHLDTQGRFK